MTMDEGTRGTMDDGRDAEYRSVSAEVAAIDDPSVSPRGPDMGSPWSDPSPLADKTVVLEVGDTVNWTSQDIYWPSVINAESVVGDAALDKYHLYYSEDHTAGSIAVASAPHPQGPWTDYGSNPIFEPYADEQNETPSVVPDGNGGLLMFYHTTDDSGPLTQSTAVATSSDGLSWTDQGWIDEPDIPEINHNGYFRPARVGDGWIAWHLARAQSPPLFGTSTSTDGLSWDTDPTLLSLSIDTLDDSSRRVEWNTTNVLNINGQLWWVGNIKDRQASGTSRGNATIAIAPFYGERSIGRPRVVGTPTEPWEGTNLYSPWVFSAEGKMWVAYTTDGSKIAVADMGRCF